MERSATVSKPKELKRRHGFQERIVSSVVEECSCQRAFLSTLPHKPSSGANVCSRGARQRGRGLGHPLQALGLPVPLSPALAAAVLKTAPPLPPSPFDWSDMDTDSGFIVVHEKKRAPPPPPAPSRATAASEATGDDRKGSGGGNWAASTAPSMAPTDFMDSVNNSPTASLSSSYSASYSNYRSSYTGARMYVRRATCSSEGRGRRWKSGGLFTGRIARERNGHGGGVRM
jgi:hypothetical protein